MPPRLCSFGDARKRDEAGTLNPLTKNDAESLAAGFKAKRNLLYIGTEEHVLRTAWVVLDIEDIDAVKEITIMILTFHDFRLEDTVVLFSHRHLNQVLIHIFNKLGLVSDRIFIVGHGIASDLAALSKIVLWDPPPGVESVDSLELGRGLKGKAWGGTIHRAVPSLGIQWCKKSEFHSSGVDVVSTAKMFAVKRADVIARSGARSQSPFRWLPTIIDCSPYALAPPRFYRTPTPTGQVGLNMGASIMRSIDSGASSIAPGPDHTSSCHSGMSSGAKNNSETYPGKGNIPSSTDSVHNNASSIKSGSNPVNDITIQGLRGNGSNAQELKGDRKDSPIKDVAAPGGDNTRKEPSAQQAMAPAKKNTRNGLSGNGINAPVVDGFHKSSPIQNSPALESTDNTVSPKGDAIPVNSMVIKDLHSMDNTGLGANDGVKDSPDNGSVATGANSIRIEWSPEGGMAAAMRNRRKDQSGKGSIAPEKNDARQNMIREASKATDANITSRVHGKGYKVEKRSRRTRGSRSHRNTHVLSIEVRSRTGIAANSSRIKTSGIQQDELNDLLVAEFFGNDYQSKAGYWTLPPQGAHDNSDHDDDHNPRIISTYWSEISMDETSV